MVVTYPEGLCRRPVFIIVIIIIIINSTDNYGYVWRNQIRDTLTPVFASLWVSFQFSERGFIACR